MGVFLACLRGKYGGEVSRRVNSEFCSTITLPEVLYISVSGSQVLFMLWPANRHGHVCGTDWKLNQGHSVWPVDRGYGPSSRYIEGQRRFSLLSQTRLSTELCPVKFSSCKVAQPVKELWACITSKPSPEGLKFSPANGGIFCCKATSKIKVRILT